MGTGVGSPSVGLPVGGSTGEGVGDVGGGVTIGGGAGVEGAGTVP